LLAVKFLIAISKIRRGTLKPISLLDFFNQVFTVELWSKVALGWKEIKPCLRFRIKTDLTISGGSGDTKAE
jgi:hypothetical protein